MTLKCLSPVDGSLVAERAAAGDDEIGAVLERAQCASRAWRETSVEERGRILTRFVEAFEAKSDDVSRELTWQMGRPVTQTPGEVRGLAERARYMIECAPHALSDVVPEPKPGFQRFIRRAPLGVVLVLAPWNYPYLTAVNALVPALMAGNAVVLKHSEQTLLCAERFSEALSAAGLPEHVFQIVHCDHDAVAKMIESHAIDYVAFTGSVAGGHAVQRAAASRFIGVGLELGGKDPAYVRSDADVAHAVENLVDGAFYNSGQSCCGIERIYVHASRYAEFVDRFVAATQAYRLGNPLDPETNLGPLVRSSAAEFVRDQIAEAVSRGARALVDEAGFAASRPGTPYLAPQVLVDVDHTMRVMTEESFGPVVGIMSVGDDAEALRLMNDSHYGLTASLWTQDEERAIQLGAQIQTGTCFMNRCDYLDPALAWTGVKDSGRGCTLSELGYAALTRPQSYHLRRLS